LELLARVRDQQLTLTAVAELLPLSYRQTKRIWRRYQAEGDAGLVHRLRGRPSPRRIDPDKRQQILELYESQYEGFGPTLAAEKLAQRDGLPIDHETLRRWLIQKNWWKRQRRRSRHRQRRERKPHRGELIQIDGSEHDWFEGRGPRAVLMVMIDDATNITYARFYEAEDTRAAFDLFGRYYDRYGLPQALYADLDSIYRVNEPLESPPRQRLTQFGRAMQQLGVRIVPAYSPQAKGRVERRNGVFQDRLVKEMRLERINAITEANRYLEQTFLPDLNARFTVTAAQPADLHRKLSHAIRLEEVLCWQEPRVVARDWTVSWDRRSYQIDKRHAVLSLVGRRVTVRTLLDGRRQLLYQGQKLHWRELPHGPHQSPPAPPVAIPASRPRRSSVPRPDHPWRRWGIAASAKTRRAGPLAPATDCVSLKEGSPQKPSGQGERPGERLAITTLKLKRGRNAVNVGGCGGRQRRRGTIQGTFLSS
jgi:hypothetical protein